MANSCAIFEKKGNLVMQRDFENLARNTSLGFYNCCEATTAFIWHKKENKAYHFFTLFSMEERVRCESRKVDILPKLVAVGDELSLGIVRRIMPVEEVNEVYRKLKASVDTSVVDIGDGSLEIGRLEEIPAVFVPQDGTIQVPLNKVLKNNFTNGSYLLEFFDTQKRVNSLLGQKEQRKACEVLYRYVPIDLFTIADRIGNFIFQFPSLNIHIDYRTDELEQEITYHVMLDERLKGRRGIELQAEFCDDNTVLGFGIVELDDLEVEKTLYVGDASKMCKTTIIDRESGVILGRQEATFIRSIVFRAHMSAQFSKPRILYGKDGLVKDTVGVVSGQTIKNNYKEEQRRSEWIENRKYKLRMEELENRKEFLRYGANGTSDRNKAIADIRELMGRGDGNKVYLWDPYLTARDLLDTWYYTKTYGMELKAITSRADAEMEGDAMEKWIASQREQFETGSDNYGINLELRCQWKGYGFGFHDRFLMIVKENEPAEVWSLGTSINSVGEKHHIIQKVSHPQMIVDAFEELWEMLDAEECLVWKSRN